MSMTRRDALRAGIVGAASLWFADRLGGRLRRRRAVRPREVGHPDLDVGRAVAPRHVRPEARRRLRLLRPARRSRFRPTSTASQIGELLPLLAKQADKYSIIRSMTHGINAHETASYAVQTGRTPGDRLVYPGAGAIVSLLQGYNAGYTGLIPPVHRPDRAAGALLGSRASSGRATRRSPPAATRPRRRSPSQGVITPGITEERQRSRRDLLRALEHAWRAPCRATRRSRRSRRRRTRPTS